MSVCFETRPLEAPLFVVGKAVLKVKLSFEGPRALVVLRLNEIWPDGTSARVAFGIHRLKRPEGVAPGEVFEAEIPLKGVAHEFSPGRRIRLAVSTSYWPLVWPEPGLNAVTLLPGSMRFVLPGMPAEVDETQPAFGAAIHACPVPTTTIEPGESSRVASFDLGSGRLELNARNRRATWEIDGLRISGTGGHSYAVLPDDGASATAMFHSDNLYERDGLRLRMATSSKVFWEEGAMVLESRYEAWEGETQVFARDWRHRLPY